MNFPPVTILVRSGDGKITRGIPSDEVSGAIRRISDGFGFSFLILWLCRYCLYMAQQSSFRKVEADLWIERYKAIREIQ